MLAARLDSDTTPRRRNSAKVYLGVYMWCDYFLPIIHPLTATYQKSGRGGNWSKIPTQPKVNNMYVPGLTHRLYVEIVDTVLVSCI